MSAARRRFDLVEGAAVVLLAVVATYTIATKPLIDHANNYAFYVPDDNRLLASADAKFAQQGAIPRVKERSVATISLTDLLDSEHVGKIDFLTMDIELSEPKALAGFDVSRFMPRLVCVEAHLPVRQQILDYFAGRRYVVVAKYLRADPKNLYFKPLA